MLDTASLMSDALVCHMLLDNYLVRILVGKSGIIKVAPTSQTSS